jgi:hypothetical protein
VQAIRKTLTLTVSGSHSLSHSLPNSLPPSPLRSPDIMAVNRAWTGWVEGSLPRAATAGELAKSACHI